MSEMEQRYQDESGSAADFTTTTTIFMYRNLEDKFCLRWCEPAGTYLTKNRRHLIRSPFPAGAAGNLSRQRQTNRKRRTLEGGSRHPAGGHALWDEASRQTAITRPRWFIWKPVARQEKTWLKRCGRTCVRILNSKKPTTNTSKTKSPSWFLRFAQRHWSILNEIFLEVLGPLSKYAPERYRVRTSTRTRAELSRTTINLIRRAAERPTVRGNNSPAW